MKFAFLLVFAYLVGSIPWAMIIAKAYGKDLRTIGSGNIGATNLSRALGRRWGYVCFLLDCLKGFVPVAAVSILMGQRTDSPLLFGILLGAGIAAILGHIFPVYISFKGGKGVATSFGVALAIWPYYTICSLVSLLVWVIVTLIWRYISLASIIASIVFPITLVAAIFISPAWNISLLWPLMVTAIIIPFMVILMHRKNIQRLLNGTENKVLTGNKKPVN